jgi:TPR repeat protein
VSESDKQTSLISVKSTALTQAGAKSLVTRGSADLRINEEAEEWLKKGCELRDKESYVEALACFLRGIELNPNHSVIQFMLGLSFGNGIGAPLDKVTARAWYRKAAEQGLKEAQYNLGLMYEGWNDGPGKLANYERAAYWIRKAAEQGHERAKYRLNVLIGNGLIVPRDHADVRGASEQGLPSAQRILGDLYRDGQGTPQDYEQAASWYRKAAQSRNLSAQISLAEMYSQGLVPLGLYIEFACTEANCEDAQLHLAVDDDKYLRHGCKEAAAYWYGEAAQQGSEIAASALSDLQPLLILERAKRTIEMSGPHFNFGRDVGARQRHYSRLQEAVRVLTDAGYKVRRAGWGYELENTH